MSSRKRDIASQIEKFFYGLISIALIFIIIAVIGVLVMLKNTEALVVYCIIITINLAVTIAGFIFIKWFEKFINYLEDKSNGRINS